MSDGIVDGMESGNKSAPKLTQQQFEEKKTRDAERHHASCFREVFGPPSVRSKAQKYVMDQFAFFAYYDRPLSEPPCSNEEFYGREGMRSFFLWIKSWADKPIDERKEKPPEVDRGKFE